MLDELTAKAEMTLALKASRLGGNLGGSRAGTRRTNGVGCPTRNVHGFRGLGARDLRGLGVRRLRGIGTRFLIHRTGHRRRRPPSEIASPIDTILPLAHPHHTFFPQMCQSICLCALNGRTF